MTKTSKNYNNSADTLLPYILPQAEYMYGCIATAAGMLLGYYDLHGYPCSSLLYDFSNLIEGTISVDSRGSDGGSIYDMTDPSPLAVFIVSDGYISRFYEQTESHELPFTFVNGDPNQGLNVSVWDCLADYLGTGQYWRGNSDLSTSFYYTDLDYLLNSGSVYTVESDFAIPIKYQDFKYGLHLYASERGYQLDTEATRSCLIEDFSFDDFTAEIDAGRPVLLSMQSEDFGHMVIAYGYNREKTEVIFDDTYQTGCRMTWDGTYDYGGQDYSLSGATTVVFQVTSSSPVLDCKVKIYQNDTLVSSGNVITGKTIAGGAENRMQVSSGGIASNTIVNSGGVMQISGGGIASGVTVDSQGSLNAEAGAVLTGDQIYGGTVNLSGSVSANTANVIFVLDCRSADDSMIVNNLACLNAASYSVSVSAAQGTGSYKLAGGAAGFTGCMSICSGGESFGTLAVNGSSITHDGFSYLLQTLSDTLFLNIDAVPPPSPEVLQVYADITVPTNQIVTVSALFNQDALTRQYSLNGQDWHPYVTGVPLSENGTVYFRACNGEVCSPVVSYSVDNIDKIPPAVPIAHADITGPTCGPVTVNAEFSDDTAVKQYSRDGISWSVYSDGIVFTANGTVYFRGMDEAGNISGISEYQVNCIEQPENTYCLSGSLSSYFPVPLSASGKYFLSGDFGDITGKVTITNGGKKAGAGTLRNGILNFNTGKSVLLDCCLETVIQIDVKSGMNPDYSMTLSPEMVFEPCDTDNIHAPEQLGTVSNCGVLVSDGWVGFGDEWDYYAFHLDSAAKLSFTLNSSDAAKFTVCRLNNGKLKNLQTSTVKKDIAVTTRELLLTAGDYYFTVQSTNAKKGGNANYTVTLDSGSEFFPAGDGTNDTWKSAVGQDARLSGEEITGWVGYGDAADFIKFELSGNGKIQLDLKEATVAAYHSKQIKLTCLDAKGKSVALALYDDHTLVSKKEVVGGEYYLGVTCANVKKFHTSYSVMTGLLAAV